MLGNCAYVEVKQYDGSFRLVDPEELEQGMQFRCYLTNVDFVKNNVFVDGRGRSVFTFKGYNELRGTIEVYI